MLGQRRKRWANIKTPLFQRVVFIGNAVLNQGRPSKIETAFVKILRLITQHPVLALCISQPTYCYTVIKTQPIIHLGDF